MVKTFKVDTVKDRLILYRWLLQRYMNRYKQYVKQKGFYKYTNNITDSYSLGICFYLKRKTNITIEQLHELHYLYRLECTDGVLIAPRGELLPRIKFLEKVIKFTIKLKD